VQSSPPVRIDDDVTWRRVSRRASQSQTCRQLTDDGRVEAKRSERTRSADAMRDAVASRVRKTRGESRLSVCCQLHEPRDMHCGYRRIKTMGEAEFSTGKSQVTAQLSSRVAIENRD
jgi:hypothetical protein